MAHLRTVLLILALTTASATPGRADDWKDCANVAEEEAAISACSRLISRGKLSRVDRATVYSNRGAAYLNREDYALALKDLDESLHLDAEAPLAHYNRGATHFFTKEYDRAVRDLTRALRLDASHANSYLYRGRSHLALKRANDAIKDFTAGLRLEPERVGFYRYRGDAFFDKRDYNSAIGDYSQFLATYPDNVAVASVRGVAHLNVGNHEAALADFTTALRLDPQDRYSLYNRARALLRLRRASDALSDVDRALQLQPGLAIGMALRGDILETLGRRDEALAVYEQALKLDPALQEAIDGRRRLTGATATSPPDQATNRARLSSLQAAYNTVGLDLLGELTKAGTSGSGNIALSPYSVGSAMAMTLNGASGDTERQMQQVLRHTLPRQDLAETNLLARQLVLDGRAGSTAPSRAGAAEAKDQGFALKIANALALGPTGQQIAPAYIAGLTVSFGAQALENASKASINAWVRERTDGRIETIVDDLPADFSLVLLNAIAMKARWAEPFDARNTRDGDFTLATGERVAVPTMRREGAFSVAEWKDLRAIRMPYADPAVTMIVVISDRIDQFAGAGLGAGIGDIDALLAGLIHARAERVELALPRFTVTFKSNLVEPFQRLGMRRPFSAGAQFDGMLRSPGGALLIDQIQHRVMVDVGELGTAAVAATAVVMAPGAGRDSPDKKVFRVDRPFLFFISDYKSGAMLFVGRVVDPRTR